MVVFPMLAALASFAEEGALPEHRCGVCTWQLSCMAGLQEKECVGPK